MSCCADIDCLFFTFWLQNHSHNRGRLEITAYSNFIDPAVDPFELLRCKKYRSRQRHTDAACHRLYASSNDVYQYKTSGGLSQTARQLKLRVITNDSSATSYLVRCGSQFHQARYYIAHNSAIRRTVVGYRSITAGLYGRCLRVKLLWIKRLLVTRRGRHTHTHRERERERQRAKNNPDREVASWRMTYNDDAGTWNCSCNG